MQKIKRKGGEGNENVKYKDVCIVLLQGDLYQHYDRMTLLCIYCKDLYGFWIHSILLCQFVYIQVFRKLNLLINNLGKYFNIHIIIFLDPHKNRF